MTRENRVEFEGGDKVYDHLVEEYLKYGSVDEVMAKNPYSGGSWAGLHRELNTRGIVKLGGRPRISSKYPIMLLHEHVQIRQPVETIYNSYMLPSFKEKLSVASAHRYVQYIVRQFDEMIENKKKGRKSGTALCIYNPNDPRSILVGRDLSAPNDRYRKTFGSMTIPMGYSEFGNDKNGVLRIFQQEVATPSAIRGELKMGSELTEELLENVNDPILEMDVADVRVRLHAVPMPERFLGLNSEVSSGKIADHMWVDSGQIANLSVFDRNIRGGVVEMTQAYNLFLSGKAIDEPKQCNVNFNVAQLQLRKDLDRSVLVPA